MIKEPIVYSWKLDRHRSLKYYREWADQAWQQYSASYPEVSGSEDYAVGFRDGFVDYVYAGGDGQPPPVPPRHFWNVDYRSAEGQAAASQWFAGYRDGAAVARNGGYRSRATVESSMRRAAPRVPGGYNPTPNPYAGVEPIPNRPEDVPAPPGSDVEALPPTSSDSSAEEQYDAERAERNGSREEAGPPPAEPTPPSLPSGGRGSEFGDAEFGAPMEQSPSLFPTPPDAFPLDPSIPDSNDALQDSIEEAPEEDPFGGRFAEPSSTVAASGAPRPDSSHGQSIFAEAPLALHVPQSLKNGSSASFAELAAPSGPSTTGPTAMELTEIGSTATGPPEKGSTTGPGAFDSGPATRSEAALPSPAGLQVAWSEVSSPATPASNRAPDALPGQVQQAIRLEDRSSSEQWTTGFDTSAAVSAAGYESLPSPPNEKDRDRQQSFLPAGDWGRGAAGGSTGLPPQSAETEEIQSDRYATPPPEAGIFVR